MERLDGDELRQLVKDARHENDKAEEDPAAQGLRMQAIERIDKAHHHVEEAFASVR